MGEVAGFTLLTIASVVVLCFGLYVTRGLDRSPDHSPPRRLAFDLCRMGSIWMLGDLTVSLGQRVDPVTMAAVWEYGVNGMATSTMMIFVLHVVTWLAFFFFQWQTMRGTHPWDVDVAPGGGYRHRRWWWNRKGNSNA